MMMSFRRFRRDLVLLTAAIILQFSYGSGVAQAQAAIYLPLVTTVAVTPPTIQPIAIDDATMDFYTVEGASEEDIRASINGARPPGGYDALTKWDFQWSVPGDGNGSCNLDDVTIDYTIIVFFPQWTPPGEATAELLDKWNGYINALALHESGHVERVVPYVPELIANIKESSCDSYNAAAQGWLDAIDQLNAEYDADTDHGATQGAVFP